MLILGTRNTNPQTLTANQQVNLGSNYSVWCKSINGVKGFSRTDTTISLNQQGKYEVTAIVVASGTATGNLSLQATENGEDIPGAIATDTISVANTTSRTYVLNFFVTVDSNCVLGVPTTTPKTIAFDFDADAVVNNVIVNVKKVVGLYA